MLDCARTCHYTVIVTKYSLFQMQYSGGPERFMDDGQRNPSADSTRSAGMEKFEALYEKYANDVLRVSYFYLGDRMKAEDVCQDVFVRLITNAPALEEGHEKAWLLKVALNRCRDLWRAGWMRRVVLGSPAMEMVPAPDEIDRVTEKAELMDAVHRLPSGFREVFLLHYYQGYGISEISQMLKLPEGTISSRLSRGRKKLEELLGEGYAQ